jgi:hypothetical protein
MGPVGPGEYLTIRQIIGKHVACLHAYGVLLIFTGMQIISRMG